MTNFPLVFFLQYLQGAVSQRALTSDSVEKDDWGIVASPKDNELKSFDRNINSLAPDNAIWHHKTFVNIDSGYDVLHETDLGQHQLR